MRYLFFLLFSIFFSFQSLSQTVKGIVYEINNSGKEIPIFGANVYYEGTNTGTISNLDGTFSIKKDSKKKLAVSYVGYTLESYKIIKDAHVFYLKQSIDLDAVKVQSKVNSTTYSLLDPLNIQTVSEKELKKAACCNLSESFSTNATVDVTFNDPVTGAKQIQMLGLDGIYTQITQENMPLMRGLVAPYGLHYIPGNWIESIHIIKGAGSVVNGYESFTGQINLEYHKPQNSNKLFFNGYINSEDKKDLNFAYSKKEGKWLSNLFLHTSLYNNKSDYDGNGFIDMPIEEFFTVFNRWDLVTDDMHFAINFRGLVDEKNAGQLLENYDYSSNLYTSNLETNLLEISTKTGFFLNDKPFKNIGIQTSLKRHFQTSHFGNTKYEGLHESIYLNFIAQTYIRHNHHIVKYGFSHYTDHYNESFNEVNYDRLDLVSGLFLEYTYVAKESFTLVAGFRSDYHDEFGFYHSPRLNIKYNPSDNMAIRFSGGKAFRLSKFFVENISHFASSREVLVAENLKPENGWNYGVNINYCFEIFDREGTINLDAYRTDFLNQVVVDIEDQHKISFYNLEGVSYANSAQLDLAYEFLSNFDIKLAYKLNDVVSTFDGIRKNVPLFPSQRGLVNLAYSSINEDWKFDLTLNYIGESRLPSHTLLNQDYSSGFNLFNTQVTRKFSEFELYLGCENISNYTQENPILDAQNPFGDNFDASIIWAPTMGRIIYVGFRYIVN